MSKKYMKRGLLSAALAVATLGSGSAFAGIPVFDAANFAVNALNAVIDYNIYLKMGQIQESLTSNGEGTMLYYTENIDSSTKSIDYSTQNIDTSTHNIDLSTKSIDKSTQNIDTSTHNIDISTENISNKTNLNYDINKTFKYFTSTTNNDTTNNYYGTDTGGIIPTSVDESLATMLDKDNVEGYRNGYKDAASYQGAIANSANLTNVGVQATAMQKTANDALVNTLSSHRDTIKQQAADIEAMTIDGVKAQGHGNQLQYANALAGAQAVQLVEIREMMLASENARAAASQADADRKSRQVAASQSLRAGLAGGDGAIKISGTGLGGKSTF